MTALFVAWRPESPQEGWRPVGRLEHDAGVYRFVYTAGAKKPGFQPFSQMEDLDGVYESEELLPIFANRLLSQSRPEYEDFLRWGGFDSSSPPDPLAILGVTEGIRPTDAVEVFPCPQPDVNGSYVNKFFLHGIRWVSKSALDRIDQLQPGDRLKLMFDAQNESDPFAVAIRTADDSTLIGYIPRYLANDVGQLIGRSVRAIEMFVDRVNRDAPTRNRLLCRMHANWPEKFVPCSGEDFQPIPAAVEARP